MLTLIDQSLIKKCELIIIINLIFFLSIFQRSSLKFEELAIIFINNKILSRMNSLLLEIFSDEANFENEQIGILFERVLDVLIRFTDVNIWNK